MAEIEQSPVADALAPQPAQAAAPQPGSGLKRKRPAVKTISLDVMAAKIKQLQEKADQAEAVVAEMEAAIVSKRAEAVAMRNEARKAAQEYVRKQCEEAIAKLDSSVPQKPSNPYFTFKSHARTSPESQSLGIKKLAAMWNALTE